jgi:hypothetical protein
VQTDNRYGKADHHTGEHELCEQQCTDAARFVMSAATVSVIPHSTAPISRYLMGGTIVSYASKQEGGPVRLRAF